MKSKILVGILVAGCLFSGVAFGQTVQITGTVTVVTSSMITLKSGADVWTINRGSTTSVTSGNLSVGSTVTVKCASPDAHKNEGTNTAPTPTPAGS